MEPMLKHQLYLAIVRPTDQETAAVEKTVGYTYRSQEKGAQHAIGGHMQQHCGGSGYRGMGNSWQESFLWFLHTGNRQGRVISKKIC